jgi:AcrR family transcriptional regulator
MPAVKPVPPTWRQQQAQATRDRIAQSARELFAANGYATTSIDAIAQRAGVAQRTVYAAFGSKREILSEICEAWLARARARESAAEVLAEPDPDARLRGAAGWLADLYGAGLDVAVVLESASDENPETQQLLRAKLAGRDRIMSDFIRSLKPWLAVPAPEALALFRALAAPGVYRELVERAGWDRDRFAAWAAATMGREILRP